MARFFLTFDLFCVYTYIMKKSKPYNKINPIIYYPMRFVCKLFCKFKLGLDVKRRDFDNDGRRKVVLLNHESAYDFMIAYSIIPKKIHLVASNSYVRGLSIHDLMLQCGLIGKNQFSTLVGDMKKMKAVLDDGNVLGIFPAGLMPEAGVATPTPPATAKTLKWFNADVYVCKIRGTYLATPKWSKIKRKGRCTAELYKLATAEEYAKLSPEEASKLIEKHLYFDAYRNNLEDKIEYKNGDNVEGLENVLYRCPSCNLEYSIKSNNNVLTCSNCGYSVKSDKLGILHKNSDHPLHFSLVSDWHAHIEKYVYEKIKANPDFKLQTIAEIHKINDKKHRFERAGNATVTLDLQNFTIDGVLFGEKFQKCIYAGNFPTLPFVPGKRFEIQDGNDIYRIYPENPKICMEFIFAVKSIFKIIHE